MPARSTACAVVELTHEHVAFAGKLLADLGADVIVVEPPGGSPQRTYGPFLDDEPGPERSLWWWHYNTSKRSVVADLGRRRRRARRALVAGADVAARRRDARRAGRGRPRLADARRPPTRGSSIVSITPFGATSPRADEPVTDLTLLAEGGPVWSCGYDDHSLPPVRGGGNQGFHTAGNWAVMSLLVALLAREETGAGQHIDVSMLAASQRHDRDGDLRLADGRRRGAAPDRPPRGADPHAADAGALRATAATPRPACRRATRQTFAAVLDLLDRLGLRDEFPSTRRAASSAPSSSAAELRRRRSPTRSSPRS